VGRRQRDGPGEGERLGGKAGAAEGALGGEEGPLPRRERDGLQSTRETGKLRGLRPREIDGGLKRRGAYEGREGGGGRHGRGWKRRDGRAEAAGRYRITKGYATEMLLLFFTYSSHFGVRQRVF
jgi:hypothetical protein